MSCLFPQIKRVEAELISQILLKMVKARDCENTSDLKRGLWSPEEDQKLIAYISNYGIWNWTEMSKPAGREQRKINLICYE